MRSFLSIAALGAAVAIVACSDQPTLSTSPSIEHRDAAASTVVQAFACSANVLAKTVSCEPESPAGIANTGDKRLSVLIGNQNQNVHVETTIPTYDGSTYKFIMTVQNMLPQPLATTNGTTPSGYGLKVGLAIGPTVTSGTGIVAPIGDGAAFFTAPAQPYYEFGSLLGPDGILSPAETSGPKNWTFVVPPTVNTFTFAILVSTDVQFPNAGQGGNFFERYVAMGSSATAGYRNGGLVDSTQATSFATMLAARAGVSFGVPYVNQPGCPPPTLVFGSSEVTPSLDDCTLKVVRIMPNVGQNIGTPMTYARNFESPPATGSEEVWRTVLLSGPQTQLQRLADASPTFVTLELGQEDVNGAALAGRLGTTRPDSALSRLDVFSAGYSNAVSGILAVPTLRGAALVGVLDPVTYLPSLQYGSFFFLARDGAGRFNGMLVNANCSPVTPLGQPNPLSLNRVSYDVLNSGEIEINCDPAGSTGGRYLVDSAEATAIHDRVAQYNNFIRRIANDNGWAYIDPNVVFASALTSTTSGRYQELRKCQLIPTATTAAQFQTAVLNSCPVTGPTKAPIIGGLMFSSDGINYSLQGARRLLAQLAQAINDKYGTTLATAEVIP